jgi:DNA-damage-inducible protein J
MTDIVVRSRIDPRLKAQAAQLFKHFGLSLSDAIRLFLRQSVNEKRIPFAINIPNKKTQQAFSDISDKKHLEKTSITKLKKEWDDVCGE